MPFVFRNRGSNIVFSIACTCLGLVLLPLFTGHDICQSSSRDEIKQQIQRKKGRIDEKKEDLSRLTKKEKRLCKEIDKIEQRLSKLEKKYSRERSLYEDSRDKVEELQKEAREIEAAVKEIKKDIRSLLVNLWPVYLKRNKLQVGSFSSWPQVDLNFTWLSSLYNTLEKRVRALSEAREELDRNLSRQQSIQENMQSQMDNLQSTREQLLKERLIYLNKVNNLRTKQVVIEEQLAKIQKTIKELQYKLTIDDTHKLEKIKGYLPWPVKGEILFDYNLQADPPREGIGFALKEKSIIRSISWGKVVYNDKLRGFGRVVIVYHGDKYYSLYAFLADSEVEVGRDVEKGEPLGRAGFYPRSNGPGMYFELRCGQKPIDPGPWLSEKK